MSLITKIVKNAVSAAVVLGLAVGMQAPLANTASADSWRGHRDGYRYAPPPRAYYSEPRRRRDVGGQIAKGVAIGIGAAVVGAILADQARRTRDRYYATPEYDAPHEPGY